MTAPLSAASDGGWFVRLRRAVRRRGRHGALRAPVGGDKLMQRVRETGSAAPARIVGYRKPLLAGHEPLLRELTTAEPGITLAEIQAALIWRGIQTGSLATIWPTLRRLGLRHKKSC